MSRAQVSTVKVLVCICVQRSGYSAALSCRTYVKLNRQASLGPGAVHFGESTGITEEVICTPNGNDMGKGISGTRKGCPISATPNADSPSIRSPTARQRHRQTRFGGNRQRHGQTIPCHPDRRRDLTRCQCDRPVSEKEMCRDSVGTTSRHSTGVGPEGLEIFLRPRWGGVGLEF